MSYGKRFVWTAVAALAAAIAGTATQARAADAPAPRGERLYAGVAAAALRFEDAHDGLRLTDSSAGSGLYVGFLLKQHLALELSYDSFDAIDRHDVAGSGVRRLDVATERRTVALSVLREISLADVFGWRRDWRLFGTLGAYDSRIDRTVTTRASDTRASATDDATGLALGAGVLYRIGRVELRGYVRNFGVLDRGEAREAGAAVQLRF